MGSKTFDGVRFSAFSHDHPPPHVHGYYAGIAVIVELDEGKRQARLAERRDHIVPSNGKRSDVNHVLTTAAKYFDEVLRLWKNS